MHGLMENAIYGGRVDNTYDMRVLQSYLLQLFDTKLLTGEVNNLCYYLLLCHYYRVLQGLE